MTVRILIGDCRDVLRTLPAESVHCVVTSPPYWGLRDYKIPPSIWGGADDCKHEWGSPERTAHANSVPGPNGLAGKNGAGHRCDTKWTGLFCIRCGAWCGAHGLEPTFDLYIQNEVATFREVRRVLRVDGTLWLNLGDSYATGTSSGRNPTTAGKHGYWENPSIAYRINGAADGLKPKDLCGIPWRVALALQADGWWLRQDIIWSKPNPMPESVTDRCTKAHEYLFLLSKSERYHYDADAIAEPMAASSIPRLQQDVDNQIGTTRANGGAKTNGNFKAAGDAKSGMRNRRSVWEVTTQPFSEAHFATFPPALIEPCIKAGCAENCCPLCAAPWAPIVERVDQGWDGSKYGERVVAASGGAISGGTDKSTLGSANGGLVGRREVRGYAPTCNCPAHEPVRGTVLDPFGGAGTTGLVADRLSRNAILIELNPEYAAMAERRIRKEAGFLADVVVTEQTRVTEGHIDPARSPLT